MANDKQTTTLEIQVDDRDVRGLQKTLEAALNPKHVEDYNKQIAETNKRLKETHTTQRHHERQQRARRGPDGRFLTAGTGGAGGGSGLPPGVTVDANGRHRRNGRFVAGGAGDGGGGGPGGSGAGGGGDIGSLKRMLATGFGAYAGVKLGNAAGGMVGSAMGGDGLTSTIAGALPVVGPIIQGALAALQKNVGAAVGADKTIAQAMGTTGIRNPSRYRAIGKPFGMGESETAQQAQQISGSSLLRGKSLEDVLPKILGMEKFSGISSSATSSLLGASITSTDRGARGSSKGRSELLDISTGAGRAAQLTFNEMSGWLEELASITKENRARGIDFSAESLAMLAANFGSLGGSLAGVAGTKVATSMSAQVRDLGDQGNYLDQVALRVAQKRDVAEGGSGSYFGARKQLEESAEALVPDIIASLKKSFDGLGEEGISEMLATMMNITRTQAEKLVRADMDQSFTRDDLKDWGSSYASGRKGELKGGITGRMKSAATLDDADVSLGRGSSGAAQGLREKEQKIAKALQPAAIKIGKAAIDAAQGALDGYGKAEKEAGKHYNVVRNATGKQWKDATEKVLTGISEEQIIVMERYITAIAAGITKIYEAIKATGLVP